MIKTLCGTAVGALALAAVSTAAWADAPARWTVDKEASQVAFGSVKKSTVGEVHTFSDVTGSIDKDGNVNVEVATSSLQTNIDIRNERMLKWVFDAAFPKIKLAAKLDMAAVSKLAVGATDTVDVEGKLTLNGKSVDIETEMFVARLSKDKVMATTASMIFVSMKDLGVDAGITKLMEVAKLPSITRAAPVTLRIVFNAATKQASNSQAATVVTTASASTGDIKLGKGVYKKCRACHEVKKEKNKVGPHLVNVVGRKIAGLEGFKYSKGLKKLEGNWTIEALTGYLENPKKYAPGTRMAFRGLKKPEDIQNVIAYIDSFAKK